MKYCGQKRLKTSVLLAGTVLIVGFLSGCMVGPKYQRPVVPTPPDFREPDAPSQVEPQSASFADLPWWKVFQDPQLQDIVHTALRQNYNVQLAAERISAARAQLAITHSYELPQVQGQADPTGLNGSSGLKSHTLLLAADAAFQLDLFGRLRRANEAARAELLATQEAQRTVMLTLVSDVASNYFALLDLDLRLQITRDTVKSQTDAVRLTNLRLERGLATKLDVLQAQQVLDTANAEIPDLRRQIVQEENAISTLLGDYPQAVVRGLPLMDQPLPPEVPPGLPSSLIERRPDIREAEQNLRAANAEIGVARAAYFPNISLTGAGGGSFGRSSIFSALMSSQTGIFLYGAQITQPIFSGGALKGNLRLAQSQEREELIVYKQTIQLAFRDVSDALIAYQQFHEVRLRQEDTVKDLRESLRLSDLRYRGGTTTYLEVLDGQRSLFSAEVTLAGARGSEYQSLVQLYRALGGGWQQ